MQGFPAFSSMLKNRSTKQVKALAGLPRQNPQADSCACGFFVSVKRHYMQTAHPHFPQLANTPAPPYYAVIFTSLRTDVDLGYAEMADKMVALAATMPGFLGVESARDVTGITVSYWADLESIRAWKYQSDHVVARDMGREHWYKCYKLRVAKVEREYGASVIGH